MVAGAPLRHKEWVCCEARQAWLLLLLRKKGRGQVGEWSQMLEIMNGSRRTYLFFYPFSCLNPALNAGYKKQTERYNQDRCLT